MTEILTLNEILLVTFYWECSLMQSHFNHSEFMQIPNLIPLYTFSKENKILGPNLGIILF